MSKARAPSGRPARAASTDAAACQEPARDGGVVLEARALRRRFGLVPAVDGLDLQVRRGELYGLVGPDGAGKTTAIRLLTGLMRPDQGLALVRGLPAHTDDPSVREAIGYMPQQYSLYGDLSVDENLRFFGQLFGLAPREFAARRQRLLGITRLERFGNRRADALSGGMYKKLALACALLHQPRVLVLDEPTNGVDPVSRRELWDLLYELVAEGMSVLLATPYMDEAERCHRVGLIHQGKLLAEDAPRTLTRGFAHGTFVLAGPSRQELELRLDRRPEVLSLTPHGSSLRAVVDARRLDDFVAWATALRAGDDDDRSEAEPDVRDRGRPLVSSVERVRPDFEDVFLGLLAHERAKETAADAPS
jgi:ABC-2 type transport system ATP-binding protein